MLYILPFIHILPIKARSNSLTTYCKNKYVDNLMFCNNESDRTFRLQSKNLYELQSIQFSTIYKHGHDGKVNTHLLCLHKLQMNYKKSFNEKVITNFCKIFFKDFGFFKNIFQNFTHNFCVNVQGFLHTWYLHRHKYACNFSSPVLQLWHLKISWG